MSVIWVFLDGVGLGVDDPAVNPWAGVQGPTLIAVEGREPSWPGALFRPLDARLGVEGLPQSATGTTALFTGVNAPFELGRHLSGFPNEALQRIILEHSVHKQALGRDIRTTFANAYNDAYFERPLNRQSVTTHAVRAAGLPFRMLDAYRDGRAVFHDLTGELIRAQGNSDRLLPPSLLKKELESSDEETDNPKRRIARKYLGSDDTFVSVMEKLELPVIGPEEAGRRIAALAADYDLVAFEYVKTDMAGHAQDPQWAASVAGEVMRFLTTILQHIDTENRDTLLIASDHGNSEDLSVRSHTLNPVASTAVGVDAQAILGRAAAITDLAPAVLDVLAPNPNNL